MPCTKCYGRDHSKADCPIVICFQCGKTGHMSFACPQPNEQRALVCWTCKSPNHKRNDRNCPGATTLFCSYCFTSGISTEDCPCNSVNTKNLKRPERMPNIRERLGRKIPPKAADNTRRQYGESAPEAPWKFCEKTFRCSFSAQIGIQHYGAFVDPNNQKSWINPDQVYVHEYNGIDHFVRTSVIIHGIKRDITFETDTHMSQAIILGADAIVAFGMQITVGGREVAKVEPENFPMILQRPSRTNANMNHQFVPFKNPINLNLALPEDEGASIRSIPMGEFLSKIDDIIDDEDESSNDEGARKPHPNRRLHRY